MDVQFFYRVLHDFTPGAAGVWTLVLMGFLYLVREWRETRKLSAEDRIARRDGYAHQVETLMQENRQQRAEMQTMRREADEYRRICQSENDQLRDEVLNLEHRVVGLTRKLADIAVRAARGDINAEMAASILQIATEAAER